jgi:hypothetical protein
LTTTQSEDSLSNQQAVEQARAFLRLKEQRGIERYGEKSIFDTVLTSTQIARVLELAGVSEWDLTPDDYLDREIYVVQQAKIACWPSENYRRAAAEEERRTGDPWSYWRFWGEMWRVHLPEAPIDFAAYSIPDLPPA